MAKSHSGNALSWSILVGLLASLVSTLAVRPHNEMQQLTSLSQTVATNHEVDPQYKPVHSYDAPVEHAPDYTPSPIHDPRPVPVHEPYPIDDQYHPDPYYKPEPHPQPWTPVHEPCVSACLSMICGIRSDS